MIYLNVYSDPKMSEQICIELKETWVSGQTLFTKLTQASSRCCFKKVFLFFRFIYIFKIDDWNMLDYNLIKRQQSTAKDLPESLLACYRGMPRRYKYFNSE